MMDHDHPVRIASFAMRAVLTKSESAGENFNLVLAQQTVYGVGFFGVLYPAYIIVLDRYDQFVVTLDEKDQNSLAPHGHHILLVAREVFLLLTNNEMTQTRNNCFIRSKLAQSWPQSYYSLPRVSSLPSLSSLKQAGPILT